MDVYKYSIKIILSILSLFSIAFLYGQEDEETGTLERKFSKKKDEREKASITDYKIISFANDTTYLDTTLTIEKDYRFNYLRRDNFELVPFSNTGRTYTSLAKQNERLSVMPHFGARARHFNYMQVEDISFYHVPTPLTELYYKSVFEQGQNVDSFFTINTSPNLNFSAAYKGLRSLGQYQHILTSTGNLRFTTNFQLSNKKYGFRAIFLAQDQFNEENGGLNGSGLVTYLLGDRELDDRAALTVNYEDAQTMLRGKTFYFDHHYDIIRPADSLLQGTRLFVRHQSHLIDKFYRFEQGTASPAFFGDSFIDSGIHDRTSLEDFTNTASVVFSDPRVGTIDVHGSYSDYNYGYDRILRLEEQFIPNRIKGNTLSAGGTYSHSLYGFDFRADGQVIIDSDDFEGNYIQARFGYRLNSENSLHIQATQSDVAPNYNFLLHQSAYRGYNWRNTFENINTQTVQLQLNSKVLFDLEATYQKIENYTYFRRNSGDSITKPVQFGETLDVLKAKAHRKFTLWRFSLDTDIMYQTTNLDTDDVYNVPELSARGTFYYSDHLFRRALFMQAGVAVKYWTSFKTDVYDPLLGEFYVASPYELPVEQSDVIETASDTVEVPLMTGNFPIIDIFVNAKVRQTRIFVKAEHFNELFQQNTSFVAPGYPYRDFIIRFGLVWNFFL